jgi:hypothetical protein
MYAPCRKGANIAHAPSVPGPGSVITLVQRSNRGAWDAETLDRFSLESLSASPRSWPPLRVMAGLVPAIPEEAP